MKKIKRINSFITAIIYLSLDMYFRNNKYRMCAKAGSFTGFACDIGLVWKGCFSFLTSH